MHDKKIQNIIFDLDGTLLDSASDIYVCVNYILKEYNLKTVDIEIIKNNIGHGAKYLIENILAYSFELSNKKDNIASIYDSFFKDYLEYYEHYSANNSKLYEGILDSIKALHNKKYNMFILTNKPHNVTIATIDCVGITPYFVEIIGYGKYKYSKPSIELWNLLSKKHNIAQTDTIMIGDGIPDYQFAYTSGCHLCMVLYGITKKEDLLALNAEKYAETFDEVLHHIYHLHN